MSVAPAGPKLPEVRRCPTWEELRNQFNHRPHKKQQEMTPEELLRKLQELLKQRFPGPRFDVISKLWR